LAPEVDSSLRAHVLVSCRDDVTRPPALRLSLALDVLCPYRGDEIRVAKPVRGRFAPDSFGNGCA